MELTAWTVYWITRCDAVGSVAGNLTIGCFLVSVLGTAFLLAWWGDEGDGVPPQSLWRALVCAWTAAVVTLAASVFVPTTKEMCAILVIPELAQNEDLTGLGGEIVGLAREWVDELRPKGGN